MNKKNLFRMSISIAYTFLLPSTMFFSCKQNDPDVVIIDDDDAVEVNFEDVATDIRVVPLVSDEPLPPLQNVQCYDNILLFSDNKSTSIYYFEDNKFVSKLNAVGRGPGEYLALSTFTYSPREKIIYVVGYSDLTYIMKYSVPEMNFIEKIPFNGNISYLSIFDDNSFIASMINEKNDSCSINIIDIHNGKIKNKVLDIKAYSYAESDATMSCFSSSNQAFAISDNINTIGTINSKFLFSPVIKISFGDKNIPAKFLEYKSNDISSFLELAKYMRENGESKLTGCYYSIINDRTISFWYHKAINSDGLYYYCYNDGCKAHYKGFKIEGINGPIEPIGITKDGYISLFEGKSDMYLNDDEKPSSLAIKILETMDKQKDNNPIVLYYNIK